MLEILSYSFPFVWLAMATYIISTFYIKGKSITKEIGYINEELILYKEKSASGYSLKSLKTKLSGASKVLHIIITKEELIIKTFLFLLYVSKKNDLVHRIPISNIQDMVIKNGKFSEELIISFSNDIKENKKIALVSKNNHKILNTLNNLIQSSIIP